MSSLSLMPAMPRNVLFHASGFQSDIKILLQAQDWLGNLGKRDPCATGRGQYDPYAPYHTPGSAHRVVGCASDTAWCLSSLCLHDERGYSYTNNGTQNIGHGLCRCIQEHGLCCASSHRCCDFRSGGKPIPQMETTAFYLTYLADVWRKFASCICSLW